MKYLAPLLVLYALVEFTTPSGNPIWINPFTVSAVTHAHPYDCKDGANSRLILGTGYSCLREQPQDVVDKLLKALPPQ